MIQKSPVHLYQPIQVVEILFHHRTEKGWDLSDLESYGNISKRWRDEVSLLLVGRGSASSQKYQGDAPFIKKRGYDEIAMPPDRVI